jgi:hypothetical protein
MLHGHFVVIWSFFPVLVCCTKKNLAALVSPSAKKAEFFFDKDVLLCGAVA